MAACQVDLRIYLRVQYVVNLILTRHPCVQHVMVMQADTLVWSSLTQVADPTR